MTRLDGQLDRLREQAAAPGTTEAAVAELVRSSADAVPPGSKARVRAALLARQAPSRALWLRPVVALAMLLILAFGGAGASAAGRTWLGHTVRRLVAWVAPSAPTPAAKLAPPSPTAPQDPTLFPSPPPQEPGELRVPSQLALLPSPPPQEPGELRVPSPRGARGARGPASGSEPGPRQTDDPTLVATAVRALRRDHDAARAVRLLDDYLRRWPDGALAEEALALAIEASQARDRDQPGDGADARARTLAIRYLQRFPSGRFVETAHRALARVPAP